LHLAALHYNENSGRKQAETKEGEKRYALLYPKYKGGGHIVRKLMEESTFSKCISHANLINYMQSIAVFTREF
jgi:hypothetical protein